jgi:choline dehydrogenase-like flavoprotein
VFDDARALSNGCQLDADICIIGAGAAGITLARALSAQPMRTIVLESGGLTYQSDIQSLYAGVNAGQRYEPLDLCRVRTFGGSTDRRGWGGWCKPLAAMDFERRPWVPLSGWPITRSELDPYYQCAYQSLSLPADTAAQADHEARSEAYIPVDGVSVANEPCALSPFPHLADKATEALRVSHNVRVILHANVSELISDQCGNTCHAVKVETLTGKTFTVKAKYFVLASGGIENARILLMSDRIERDGVGNRSGFVGRCFMEHPRYAWGELSVPKGTLNPALPRLYDPSVIVGQRNGDALLPGAKPLFGASLAITAAAQQREEILGARTWLLPVSDRGDRQAGREFKELVTWLRKGRLPSDATERARHAIGNIPNAAAAVAAHFMAKVRPARKWQFVSVLEQEPDPDSRVKLHTSRDRLGLRRTELTWRVGALTEKTLNRTRELMAAEARRAGLHCAAEGKGGAAGNQPFAEARWVWHHMGTTRMTDDPKTGVVDRNGRIHGMSNLFVAGSSVFPTVGNDMPTLTIIALAHRLGDHLKALMGITAHASGREPIRPATTPALTSMPSPMPSPRVPAMEAADA